MKPKEITITLTQKETDALGKAFDHFLTAITSDQKKLKAGAFETTGNIVQQMSAMKKTLLQVLDKVCEAIQELPDEPEGIHRIDKFFDDGVN